MIAIVVVVLRAPEPTDEDEPLAESERIRAFKVLLAELNEKGRFGSPFTSVERAPGDQP